MTEENKREPISEEIDEWSHKEIALLIIDQTKYLESLNKSLNKSQFNLTKLFSTASLLIAIAACGITISASAEGDLGKHIIALTLLIIAQIGVMIFGFIIIKRLWKTRKLT